MVKRQLKLSMLKSICYFLKTGRIMSKLEGIKEILAEDDLMGLIKIGAPEDEYDSEAEHLSMVITHHSSIKFIQECLWNVFYNSFCHITYTKKVKGKFTEIGSRFMPKDRAVKMIGTISRYRKTAAKLRKFLKNQAP